MKAPRFPVLLALLTLFLTPWSRPAAAQSDCVSCAIDSDTCFQDDAGVACRCVIKLIHGTFICFERDFLCTVSGSCDADPPPLVIAPRVTAPTIAIEPGVLTKLEAKEPLLAIVLHGAVVYNKDKQPLLTLEAYPRGTIRGKEGRYTHRGIFSLRADGEASFHLVLENAADKSTVTFAGVIRDRGRRITYSKLVKLGTSLQSEKVDWKVTD